MILPHAQILLQTIATLSVVGGFVYAGIQFREYRQGQAQRDYFDSWRTRMQRVADEPSFQRVMQGTNLILPDDLQRCVETLARESAEH